MQQHPAPIRRLSREHLPGWLTPRSPLAHKGDHGRLLLVGGAIAMAGEAPLRSGAWLVRVLTHMQYEAALLMARPELIVQALSYATLCEGLDWADVVVIVPGLGQDGWAKSALRAVENCDKPHAVGRGCSKPAGNEPF
ncbi:MAG: NAD(P)H-hydrate dehydratase [Symbiopectobacterium sp.]|uniref:NAD(P)H-hydrate dehydratase n=1 Tax=Symbiopectobacterium sp. TaxID=2952789 RepID=UPI003F2AEF4D